MNQKVSNSFLERGKSPFGDGFSLSEIVKTMGGECAL